jgi:hypothetical protein
MKTLTGLNTWIYTFPRTPKGKLKYELAQERLKSRGTITILFVCNSYGFEFRKFRIVI